MDKVINTLQAKAHLHQMPATFAADKIIAISRGEKPVVKPIPIKPKGKRKFGSMRGKIAIGPEFFEPLPKRELAGWK